MIDSVGVSGHWTCTIKRANGNIESFEQPNTIHANLKDVITDAMNSADTDFDLGSSFHTNDGSGQGSNASSLSKIANGGAGISMTITGLSGHYGMSSSVETTATSSGSGYYAEWRGTVRVTETYVITAIFLGRAGNSGQTAFDTTYATGDSWSSVTLDDGDQMDIVWKVTVS